jgi:phospholipid/cholesterol/gamma-HCH transport system substrate-binding protein
MDENKLRFGVGVLVISAIGIGIILIFLFGAFPSVLQRDYTLSVVFPSAEGISVNTPVIRDGVRIGRVASIDLREEGGVLVTLSMDLSQPVTHNYLPRIGSGNFVTGDANLEFVRTDPEALSAVFGEDREIINKPYTDGEFLDYGTKAESIFEMQNDLQVTFDAIRSAGEKINVAAESVDRLARDISQVFSGSDSKFEVVADEAVRALEEFRGAMQDVRAIVGNPEMKGNLERSLAQLPDLLQEAQTTFDSTRKTFESFERVGNQFEKVGIAAEETVNSTKTTIDSFQQTADNLERFTEPLAERGDELVEQALRTMNSLQLALAQVDTFGKTLNNSDGSLKRFLEDDEIYWQIRRTVENIENATARVRPILDDVRIFTDKIARDPRELGVRGALSGRPSGVGYK